jgi:excisionase family DNA binding protein
LRAWPGAILDGYLNGTELATTMTPTSLTEIPTLDQLLADPAKAVTLPPEMAQTLLIGLVSLQPVLIQRALISSLKGRQEDELLTMRDLARRLKVSEYRAYELVRQGEIKKTSVGGKSVRVSASDLAAYLAKQRGS